MGDADTVTSIRSAYGVPSGIELRVQPGEVLAWRPGHAMAVREVAARPRDLPASPHGGRSRLGRVATEGGHALVRSYRKGGLLRHVRPGGFRGPWRPLRELVLLRRLEALGLPVVEALGAVVLSRGLAWRGWLLVREREPSVDLEAWLHGVRPAWGPTPSEVLRRAGRAVRRLHDAGVPHPDLHPKNLLLVPGGEVLILDLDKAEPREGPLEEMDRLRNLVRLGRSIEKHRLKGLDAGRREALRFLEGYAGSRAAAAAWLEPIRARLGRGLALRRLWWRLLGEARPWQPPRDAGPEGGT